ncbi:MAG TPA: hypothetical protein VHG53_06415 [Candidatus Limnocylindria bacterium]|nr:hypothetical protein [Candidatus Limnocylindria bacterium]
MPARSERTGVMAVAGFYVVEEERTYQGQHVLTRYYLARDTNRRLVARAVTTEDDWPSLGSIVRASLDSPARGPERTERAARPRPSRPAFRRTRLCRPRASPLIKDESLAVRDDIFARAASMLGTSYVWGGNTPGRGMDCSA